VLIHDPDPEDELTVVLKVLFWENSIENARSQPVEIEQELPSFVTTG
jgi:hypothetical protein